MSNTTQASHGTPKRYRQGCKCLKCKAGMRAYWRARYHEQTAKTTAEDRRTKLKDARTRRRNGPIPGYVHGTINGYCNYGCKCEFCLGAWQQQYPQQQEWRDAHREELNAKRMDYYYNVVKPREAAEAADRKKGKK